MEYTIAAYTDVGIQKESNQDSFCVRRAAVPGGGELLMAVVCDGMGGLQKGEVASAAAVRTFGGWFDGNLDRLPALCGRGFEPVRHQWEDLIRDLHSRLLAYARDRRVQLGTTLTAFLACGSRYLTVNVGDSRIYENQRQLRQLTQDQSLVAREIASGRITGEEARHHPQRNVLLQCLGAGAAVTPVFTEGTLLSGAVYLLCSDGFVHELSPAELGEALLPLRLGTREAMTETLTGLTETCKRRGETDNITAVLVKTRESGIAPAAPAGLRGLLGRLRGPKEPGVTAPLGAALLETAQIVHTTEEL